MPHPAPASQRRRTGADRAHSALRYASVLPAGSRIARTQGAWLRALEEHPGTASLRADALENLHRVARVVAFSADWRDMTTRPTWDRLMDRTGLSRRTVARWLAWLREAGLLGLVESGSTAQWRPRMAAAVIVGNRAAVYLLAVPQALGPQEAPGDASPAESTVPVDETGTPSGLPNVVGSLHAHASRETSPLRGPDRSTRAPLTSSWPLHQQPRTRQERLACAQRLQQRVPALRGLTSRHLRHLLRPWFLAGWTAGDVLYALDHTPTEDAHTWTTDVRAPAGWLRHRLGLWVDDDTQPLRPLSQQHAEIRARAESARAQLHAEREERAQLAQVEELLSARVRTVAGDAWPQMLARVAAAHQLPPRRAAGRMVESLTVTAVLTNASDHPTPRELVTDAELRAAIDTLLNL